jgi:competence protein ComEA
VEPSNAPWRALDTVDPATTPQVAAVSQPAARPWVAVGAVLAAVVIAIAAFLVASRPEPVIEVDGETSHPGVAVDGVAPASIAPAGAASIVVEVGGAVLRPGVYALPSGARVGDAIDAAGGFGPRVDVGRADQALNLAAPVRDGEEIRVPVRGEASETAPSGAGAGTGVGAEGGLIDLNRASAEALDTLPGVGPATAAKIIAAREEQPFITVDDLGSRKVVGAATLEKLRALVTVGP